MKSGAQSTLNRSGETIVWSSLIMSHDYGVLPWTKRDPSHQSHLRKGSCKYCYSREISQRTIVRKENSRSIANQNICSSFGLELKPILAYFRVGAFSFHDMSRVCENLIWSRKQIWWEMKAPQLFLFELY